MRVTCVVHQFLPRYFTGTEQYCYAIAKDLQRRGHDVEVVALDPDFQEQTPLFAWNDEEVDGLPVRRVRTWTHLDRDFERMEWQHPLIHERFRTHLEERRPDVVHVFHLRYLGAGLVDEARALGIPVAVHLMDFWFLCPAVTLRRPDGALCDGPPKNGLGCAGCVRPGLDHELERLGLDEVAQRLSGTEALAPIASPGQRGHRFARRVGRKLDLVERFTTLRRTLLDGADRIFAPSSFLKDRFVANGYPADRIEVLRYGVDPERLGSDFGKQTDRSPERLLRVLFTGSIAEHKGVHTLVDAFLQAGGGIELVLRGRESDFPDYARGLREKTEGHPEVRFEGPFERDQLGAVLGEADVLVVPSLWYENTPFVALEAQLAGVPVIASDLGGLSEIVTDGVDGLLFPAGDAEALARCLRRLASDRDLLASLAARQPAVKALTENIDEIESHYEEIVAGRG